MSWSMFIPTSMLYLGGILLVLAVVLVFVDVPGKGVPWDKVGAWFGFIGGFGVGGAAGGWLGRAFASVSGTVLTKGQEITAQALGVSVVGAIVLGLLLWAYARMRGNGISTRSKAKSVGVVVVLALIGTVFSAVPVLYDLSDSVIHWAGTEIISALQ